jgi:hypothetical protein
MSELERDLRALGTAIDWPATPDLAPAVRARLTPRPPARRRFVPRSPLVAAAAVLLALLVATALVPEARSAVLRVLGLTEAARIVRAPRPPEVTRAPLDLGRRTTLADARRQVAFAVRIPAALGPPSGVQLSRRIAGGAVTLRWPGGDALTEFEGEGTPFLEKFATQDARVRRVTVGATFGYFLDGAPHEVVVLDRNGAAVQSTRALVRGAVLLWDAGGLAYRLETRAGLHHALGVARSVR